MTCVCVFYLGERGFTLAETSPTNIHVRSLVLFVLVSLGEVRGGTCRGHCSFCLWRTSAAFLCCFCRFYFSVPSLRLLVSLLLLADCDRYMCVLRDGFQHVGA